MLTQIIDSITEERARILDGSSGAKLFLELADQAKVLRASELVKARKVKLREKSDEGTIQGTCETSSGVGEPYQISLRLRGGRIRGGECTCKASQYETCKHSLALCATWLIEQKRLWSKLGEALKILEPAPLAVAA